MTNVTQHDRELLVPAEALRYADLDLRAFYLPHVPPPELLLPADKRVSKTRHVIEAIECEVLTAVLTAQVRYRNALRRIDVR